MHACDEILADAISFALTQRAMSDILHRGKSASFFADPLPRAELTACYLEHANSPAR